MRLFPRLLRRCLHSAVTLVLRGTFASVFPGTTTLTSSRAVTFGLRQLQKWKFRSFASATLFCDLLEPNDPNDCPNAGELWLRIERFERCL
jgi:hypothetical protein